MTDVYPGHLANWHPELHGCQEVVNMLRRTCDLRSPTRCVDDHDRVLEALQITQQRRVAAARGPVRLARLAGRERLAQRLGPALFACVEGFSGWCCRPPPSHPNAYGPLLNGPCAHPARRYTLDTPHTCSSAALSFSISRTTISAMLASSAHDSASKSRGWRSMMQLWELSGCEVSVSDLLGPSSCSQCMHDACMHATRRCHNPCMHA